MVPGFGTTVTATSRTLPSAVASRPSRPLGATSAASAGSGPGVIAGGLGGAATFHSEATWSGSLGVSPATEGRTATTGVTKSSRTRPESGSRSCSLTGNTPARADDGIESRTRAGSEASCGSWSPMEKIRSLPTTGIEATAMERVTTSRPSRSPSSERSKAMRLSVAL